ncbi:MAG: hypothetical protein WD424_05215 [Paenibacillaceae bacterium]
MRGLQVIVLFIIMLVIVAPASILAAPAQLSTTAKSALEKVMSNADAKVASSLRLQYSTLLTLQEQEQQWDEKIKELHAQNEEALLLLRKQIKLIDADKLSKLETEVKKAKEQYQPLFDSYTSLNQQIKVARILKNKKLNSLLRSQADVMQIAVQLARQDIRSKEEIFQTAKDNKAKTVKKLRALLSDIDPIKVKIKSERNRMAKPKQRFTSEWKTLNSSVKKGEAKSILNTLTSIVTISKQVNEHKLKIHGHEKTINAILLSVKARIP